MSREELAEAVALWACDHDGKRRGVAFDANHLGKLERGTVRCPRQLYVDALCAVLNVTPAELGFDSAADNGSPLLALPDPVGVLDPDEREWLSLAAVQPCRTDAAALEALAAVLFAVRQLEDETGAAAVLPIVQQQLILADRLAAGVPAHARPAAVGLSSEINQYLGWLSIPLGRWDDAHRYLDRAAVVALEADDPLRLSTAPTRSQKPPSGTRVCIVDYAPTSPTNEPKYSPVTTTVPTRSGCSPKLTTWSSSYHHQNSYHPQVTGTCPHSSWANAVSSSTHWETPTGPEDPRWNAWPPCQRPGAIQNGRFAAVNLPKND